MLRSRGAHDHHVRKHDAVDSAVRQRDHLKRPADDALERDGDTASLKFALAEWIRANVDDERHQQQIWCVASSGIDRHHGRDRISSLVVDQAIRELDRRWGPKARDFAMSDEEVVAHLAAIAVFVDLSACEA